MRGRVLRAVGVGVGLSLTLAAPATAGVPAASPPATTLTPIPCTQDGLLTKHDGENMVLTRIDMVTGAATSAGTLPVAVNAAGYNVLDGFVYVWDYDNDAIGRFGAGNEYESLGLPDGVALRNFNIGDVDADGFYWLSINGTTVPWYKIDVRPDSSTFLEVIDSGTVARPAEVRSPGIDWSYVPGHPDSLYSIDRTASGDYVLVRFDTTNATKEVFANLGYLGGISDGPLSFGATYADADGFLYGSDNGSGTIVRVDVDAGTAVVFSQGPSSSVNDGAACTLARQDIDFGDAPDSYGTTLASEGPRHSLIDYDEDARTTALMLGTQVSRELDAFVPDDDTDDDAITATEFAAGEAGTVAVTVTNSTESAALLAGWFDANADGTFTDDEALTPVPVAANTGITTVNLDVPAGTTPGVTWLRLRLYGSTDVEPSPAGPAAGGEVEDWPVAVAAAAPALSITKDVAPTTFSAPGDVLTYTVAVTNTGNTRISDVSVTDPLCTLSDGPQELAAGATGTFTCTYPTTATDVAAQSVLNTATVAATGAGQDLTGSASATATYVAPQPTPQPTTDPTTDPMPDASIADPTPDPSKSPAAVAAGGGLANTGFNTLWATAASIFLLGSGILLFIVRRRGTN